MLKIIKKDLTSESTIRTPSHAKYFGIINTIDDIKDAIKFKVDNKLDIKVIGNGSNILFSKEYYDNFLFLKLGKGFKFFNFQNKYVEIGGSYSLIQAGRSLISKGYKDFIFFNLIPATIGGAIRQNAGTGPNEEIKDVCISSTLFDIKKNSVVNFTSDQLLFEYRNSLIKKNKDRFVILSAKFHLNNKVNNTDTLISEMKNRVKEKINREPKGYCFGSTFMNNKKSAWEYIDSITNDINQSKHIYFSKKHKNWIINNNGAGKDIKKIITQTQKLIKEKFNVNLKEEVDII